MRLRALLLVFPLLAGLTAFGEDSGLYPDESDHTLLVEIESVPRGARITTVPADSEAESIAVAETPYMAVIECTWDTKMLIKQWKKLRLWSPGHIARAEYDPDDKSYSIYARFVVSLQGYASQTVDTFVTSFPYIGSSWEDIDALPARETVTVQLEQEASEGAGLGAPRPPVKTVMVAAGDASISEDFGSLEVHADVENALVSADGQDVIALPVRLILREGEHSIHVTAPDLPPFERTLTVEAGQTRALRVKLAPDAAAP